MNYRMYTEKDMKEDNENIFPSPNSYDDFEWDDTYQSDKSDSISNMENTLDDFEKPYDMMKCGDDIPCMINPPCMMDMPCNMDTSYIMNENTTFWMDEIPVSPRMQNKIIPYMAELEEDDDDDCDDVKEIVEKMEKKNTEIFALLSAYGMPYQVVKRIVRRIVNLTFKYK